MKIKIGFVTNSSSCSFIITIITKKDKSIKEFKSSFNKFLDMYEKSYYGRNKPTSNLQFWNPNIIEKKSNNVFEISDWTTMYNDYEDIPHYIRHLLLMTYIDPSLLEEILDLESLKFKKDEDG